MHPDKSILSEENSGVHAGAVGELVQRQADVLILYQHRLTCMLVNHVAAENISSTSHDWIFKLNAACAGVWQGDGVPGPGDGDARGEGVQSPQLRHHQGRPGLQERHHDRRLPRPLQVPCPLITRRHCHDIVPLYTSASALRTVCAWLCCAVLCQIRLQDLSAKSRPQNKEYIWVRFLDLCQWPAMRQCMHRRCI